MNEKKKQLKRGKVKRQRDWAERMLRLYKKISLKSVDGEEKTV